MIDETINKLKNIDTKYFDYLLVVLYNLLHDIMVTSNDMYLYNKQKIRPQNTAVLRCVSRVYCL